MDHYSSFMERRKHLLSLLQETSAISATLGQKAQSEHLQKIYAKVQSDQFKVMVVGTFKNGKSTFINALLGEAVLPAFSIPCTAVINEVKYGETKRGLLHFRKPLPDPLPQGISDKAKAHLKSAGREPAPMDLAVDELQAHVAISNDSRAPEEAVAESPYDKVEIFWPLTLCKNGVEIIDSPGLNEHGIREKVTVTYLAQADAVLFVMSCIALASQTEINFVEHNLHNSGHREIFFICNRYDQLDSEQDQQRVRNYALQKLSPLTDLEKGVYFLSAKNALNGRVKKKPDLLEESGILELEEVLSDFLVNQRGRLKLRTPAFELQRVLGQLLREVIPGQIKLLSLQSDQLDKKVSGLLPQLEESRRSKDQMLRQMDYHFELLHRDVRDVSSNFLRDLAEQIPTIINNAKVNTRITTFTMQHKKQIEGVIQEIMDQLDIELKIRVKAWQDNELEPIFRESMLKLNRDMKLQIEEFYRTLEVIKGELYGEAATAEEGPTGQERFLATALGFVLGDIGSAAYGARFGFHGLFGAIGVQVAVVMTLFLTGTLVTPWIAIPAIILTSLGNASYAAGSLEAKIRKSTADKIQSLFRDSHSQKVAEIVAAVKEKTNLARQRGEDTLERDIQSIREQADQALAEKKKGEVEVEAKRNQMQAQANRIHGISGELRAFVT